MSSFRHTLRKKIAPIALLAALLLLTARTCEREHAQVEMQFEFGAHAHTVTSLRVDVFRDGDDESVLVFERADVRGGPSERPSLQAQLDKGVYHLMFEVGTNDGIRRFERVVHTENNATITVNIERDLAPRPPR